MPRGTKDYLGLFEINFPSKGGWGTVVPEMDQKKNTKGPNDDKQLFKPLVVVASGSWRSQCYVVIVQVLIPEQ